MTATTHALVGGLVASQFPNPSMGLPAVLASHFLLDCIPHWDLGTNWKNRPKSITGIFSVLDTVIGITLTYFLFVGKVDPLYLIAAIIMSELPDWLLTPWFIFFVNKKMPTSALAKFARNMAYAIYKIENVFHTKATFPLGLITQIGVLITGFALWWK